MSEPRKLTFELGLALATAIRASERFRPENKRIFNADFDYLMLPTYWRWLLLPGIRHGLMSLMDNTGMGTPGMLFCRTRFIDDALTHSLEKGTKQIVCLGAGFDTRAYRIPEIKKAIFFELDLPIPQMLKRERLQKMLGTLPSHVTFVPIDFNKQRLEDEMAAAGFDSTARTFFIWEGVTQYITAEAVDDTLKFASCTPSGSQIALTTIHRGIIDGSARSATDQRIMSRLRRRGMPWLFGIDPADIEGWLGERGFSVVDQAGAADYRARYLEPVGRRMNIYEGERITLAEVKGQSNGLGSP